MPTPSPHCSFDVSKEKHEMKNSARNGEETLAARRKEFINSLRMYRSFYGGLADQLCINQLAAADGQPCWNGEDVVKSYTQRVVGNGIKAQSGNPEVKVKGTDPVINQIIDKLKHVIQLLQGTSPKPNKWELLQPGSGGGMLEQVSGDCDDEDGCGGSGSGEVKKTLKITKWMPDDMNFSDVKQIHRTDHRSTLDSTEAGRASGTEPMTLTLVGLLTLLPKLW